MTNIFIRFTEKKNQNDIDYCGNREWDKNVYITESEAQARADEINKKVVGEN